MTCYARNLRAVLTTLLIAIGISSLFTNIYYVYKFGPPYQSASDNVQHVRTFSPIAMLRHKSSVRRSPVDVAPEVERKVTSNYENSTTTISTTTTTTTAAAAAASKKLSAKNRTKGSEATSVAKTITTAKVTTGSNTVATSDSRPSKLNGHNGDHVYSFLLAASYSDSVCSLPKSLLQLGQFAKDLGIHNVVGPWVFGYRMYGLKRLVANIDKGQNSLAMNRLYDLKFVNNVMAQCSGTTVTLFTDFMDKASHNVTVIYFVRSNFIEPQQFHLLNENSKVLTDKFKKAQVVDCSSSVKSNSGKDLVDALNAELTGGGEAFHISSFICVDNSKVVKMEQINNFLKEHTSNHRTVVLLNWRGYASLLKKPYDTSKYWVETLHDFPGDKCHNTLMPFHFEVPRAAHQFLSHSGISGTDYLSVYISLEYFARLNNAAYTECCLKETDRVIRSIMTKYQMTQLLIIGDHSTQSTSACDSECVKRSIAMVTTMTSWGLNVTRFNPDVTAAKHHHPVYNLFAEITLLSVGKRLLVVGQNLFYSQIKTSFLQHYPTDGNAKLYAICINSGTYLRDLSSKTVQCKQNN